MIYSIIFSPTGTTVRVAASMAEGMCRSAGSKRRVLDCTRADLPPVTLAREDVAIIAAPVYGGRMAPLAKKRMESLRGDSTPCVILSLYGNRAFEQAPVDMAGFAVGLGFVPVAAAAFVGEHSYSTPQTPIAEGRPDADDLEQARLFGVAVAERLSRGDMRQVDTTLMRDEPSPEESVANFRRFVAEYQRSRQECPRPIVPELDAALCNDCGMCAEACPTGAIGNDTKATDPALCIKCCACVKACATGARSLATPFAPVLSANCRQRKSPVLLLP